MASQNGIPSPESAGGIRAFGRARILSLVALLVLLAVCFAFAWVTRDAMAHLPFLAGRGATRSLMDRQKTLVDLGPWQTAQALAPLAVSAEEAEYAHEAERLADHEVVQAFASALRLANIQAEHRVLTGEALTLSKRVAKLQQLVREDQAQVDKLTVASNSAAGQAQDTPLSAGRNNALELAQAQLALDSDQLADAQQDLERASGDDRARIQSELTAHQAAMAKQSAEPQGGQAVAIVSAAQHRTLAHRLVSWKKPERTLWPDPAGVATGTGRRRQPHRHA
jgi:hypothetical protein